MDRLRFVDLFAGMGGFHYALQQLGHKCVFASEVDPELQQLYLQNFPDMEGRVFGDIRGCKEFVPPHDILCAGFPCQPFSKSGDQLGTKDQTRGTLFYEILEVIEKRKPSFLILENVGNFERHDRGRTWQVVTDSLLGLGYDVRGTEHVTPRTDYDWRERGNNGHGRARRRCNGTNGANHLRGHGLISPHDFGYPQHRGRFFIVACRRRLPIDPFPPRRAKPALTLADIVQRPEELDERDQAETALTRQQSRCIAHWNRLLRALPTDLSVPSFPIWGDEVDARYPYERRTPWATPPRELRKLIPGHRFPLWTRKENLLQHLPSYAREPVQAFRPWKIHFIRQNRDWFRRIGPYIPAGWIDELKRFPPSLRKLEWNAKGGHRDLRRYVLQFRPSGVRVRRYATSPALVAMTATQIPLLGPERRFLSRVEGLRLQGFPDDHALPASRAAAFHALGNAVHVGVVEEVARHLIGHASFNRVALRVVAGPPKPA